MELQHTIDITYQQFRAERRDFFDSTMAVLKQQFVKVASEVPVPQELITGRHLFNVR